MPRIPQYTRKVSPSVQQGAYISPSAGATGAGQIGRALQGVGQGIGNIADSLAKIEIDKQNIRVHAEYTKAKADLTQADNNAIDSIRRTPVPEGANAKGFYESMVKAHMMAREKLVANMGSNDRSKAAIGDYLKLSGVDFGGKAQSLAWGKELDYYQASLVEDNDKFVQAGEPDKARAANQLAYENGQIDKIKLVALNEKVDKDYKAFLIDSVYADLEDGNIANAAVTAADPEIDEKTQAQLRKVITDQKVKMATDSIKPLIESALIESGWSIGPAQKVIDTLVGEMEKNKTLSPVEAAEARQKLDNWAADTAAQRTKTQKKNDFQKSVSMYQSLGSLFSNGTIRRDTIEGYAEIFGLDEDDPNIQEKFTKYALAAQKPDSEATTKASGQEDYLETILDANSDKISKTDAYKKLFELRYGKESISHKDFQEGLNRIEEPYPIETISSLRDTLDTSISNYWFNRDPKLEEIRMGHNRDFLTWFEKQLESGVTPDKATMEKVRADLLAGTPIVETSVTAQSEQKELRFNYIATNPKTGEKVGSNDGVTWQQIK